MDPKIRLCFLALALLLCTGAIQAAIPLNERAALEALYNNTNGASWTTNTGWMGAAGTECSWHGVVCNAGETTILEINLENNNLAGNLPTELSDLNNLQQLHLNSNRISGAMPEQLGSLSNLLSLWLFSNQLSGNIPTTVGGMTSLSDLNLNNNQLTGDIPTQLENLTQLRYLGIANNKLTGSIPTQLENLSQLQYLLLADNQLSGTIPTQLGNLANLVFLGLSGNELTGSIPTQLGSLANLEELFLTKNLLNGPIPTQLGSLSKLKYLWLNDNQLSGSIPVELGNLTQLKQLRLNNNQLDGGISSGLIETGDLANLQQLWLNGNQLTGAIPIQLENLSALTDINLGTNQLDGSIPAELGNLAQLQKLYLNNNRLTGNIPTGLLNHAVLKELDLTNNQLTGTIPIPAAPATLALETLRLGNNLLTGAIPSQLGSLATLTELNLEANKITGQMPPELGNLSNLVVLRLTSNHLKDTIPGAFTGLTNLSYFFININHLDADSNGDALIPPSLQTWFNAIPNKSIKQQTPPPAPGVTIAPPTQLLTTEAAGPEKTDAFTMALNTRPTAVVTITFTSSDPSEGTVSPISLTFTPDNWFVTQQAIITGVDDAIADGNQSYSITSTLASGDPDYNGLAINEVNAVNVDDDMAGITVSPASGLVTTEAGGTDTFQVLLNTEPTADVSISLASSDTSEGTVFPASLLLTPSNWNTPRTITVSGVNDDVRDGDQSYSIVVGQAVSTDGSYQGLNPDDVAVTNRDSESNPIGAGVTVSGALGLTTTEAGATASFTIVLKSQPGAEVTIGLSSSDTTEGTVAPTSLIFTPDNWSAAQTVTITGTDDATVDGDQLYRIVIARTVSADASYDQKFDPDDVDVLNKDDDANQNDPGVTVSPTGGLVTTEAGDTANFSVALNTQPTADVTIGLSSSNTNEGTVNPVNLTFTSGNWNTAQQVTITGVDDPQVDGYQPYTIVTTASSTDSNYDGIAVLDVGVTNEDDDSYSLVITPTTGLTTTESGDTDSFTVKLDSQPDADVTLDLSSSNPAEGTVNPSSLTFTPANWSTLQTITLNGVEDLLIDGDQPYTIVTAPLSSSDANYGGLDPVDVSATNQDNDPENTCSSPPPAVDLTTGFQPGLYLCIGDDSIKTNPASVVIIESGAEVYLRAPVVELMKGFSIETGGKMHVQKPTAP